MQKYKNKNKSKNKNKNKNKNIQHLKISRHHAILPHFTILFLPIAKMKNENLFFNTSTKQSSFCHLYNMRNVAYRLAFK